MFCTTLADSRTKFPQSANSSPQPALEDTNYNSASPVQAICTLYRPFSTFPTHILQIVLLQANLLCLLLNQRLFFDVFQESVHLDES